MADEIGKCGFRCDWSAWLCDKKGLKTGWKSYGLMQILAKCKKTENSVYAKASCRRK